MDKNSKKIIIEILNSFLAIITGELSSRIPFGIVLIIASIFILISNPTDSILLGILIGFSFMIAGGWLIYSKIKEIKSRK